ncbi:MAG: ribonuclease H [bacterium]
MNWEQRSLQGKPIWARVTDEGDLVLENGRVPIKHDKDQSQSYRASPGNITLLPSDYHEQHPVTDDQIEAYVDGSRVGKKSENGPTGVGIVLRSREGFKEIGKYTGEGTNITAELNAIRFALEAITDRTRPVRLYTDSEYSINALTDWIHNWRNNGWQTSGGDPVSNQDLLKEISSVMDEFNDLELHWVEGHSGHIFNERADYLAESEAQEGQG